MSNKEDLNSKSPQMEKFKMEKFKEIKEVEKPAVPICEFCRKKIKGTEWKKEYQHINIAQTPQKRLFCSRQCKIRWIFESF